MSNLNDEVCEYNSTPTTEHFAAKNGNGFVYHRSDCSLGEVKIYYGGSDAPGSKCRPYLHPVLADIVHNKGFDGGAPGNHYWTYEEIKAYLVNNEKKI